MCALPPRPITEHCHCKGFLPVTMSSPTQLLERIEELSSAIDAQKHILEDLETSRSNARRNLNAIRDPMARLPLKMSSEIFIRCLPANPGPDSANAPMIFLSICHLWSDIAFATPSLWSAFLFRSKRTRNLQRSSKPSSVEFKVLLSHFHFAGT
jgi:hypothetical protein